MPLPADPVRHSGFSLNAQLDQDLRGRTSAACCDLNLASATLGKIDLARSHACWKVECCDGNADLPASWKTAFRTLDELSAEHAISALRRRLARVVPSS
jgi:hypothetical protein